MKLICRNAAVWHRLRDIDSHYPLAYHERGSEEAAMDNLFYVGIGGFFGANARYLLTLGTSNLLEGRWSDFPVGTLIVNVLGSFGLALFGVWFSERTGLSPHLRLLVGAGFFGAFTTFSTFANESMLLLEGDGLTGFVLNILLNNGICLLGVILGLALGQRCFATS